LRRPTLGPPAAKLNEFDHNFVLDLCRALAARALGAAAGWNFSCGMALTHPAALAGPGSAKSCWQSVAMGAARRREGGTPMSFLFGESETLDRRTQAKFAVDPPAAAEPHAEADRRYGDLMAQRPALLDEKLKLHNRIIDEFNLALLEKLSPDDLRRQVQAYIANYVRAERISFNQKELELFTDEVLAEMIGFGPIEPLLKDPTISDILINTHNLCFVERFGKLERANVRFKDEAHLLRIINKIVSGIGRRVDESSPMVDARLPDGSRVNVAIRPISVDGPLVSIRKFAEKPFDIERLIGVGTLCPQMADLLKAAVRGRISLIISGGTGTGKTTLLNALSHFIPDDERLITIEDAAELQLQQLHVGRLETRPPNIEGRGEVRQRDLVKNALRMRPDRIIVGECRGEEAFDMLQAMNTGHEGSMTTIHANSPRDALKRLEQMVAMAAMGLPIVSVRSQIASAITIIMQLQRLPDGRRRLSSINEIAGMEGEIIQMHEIFRFVKERTDAAGHIVGHFAATGIRPQFLQDLAPYGIELPASHFDPDQRW
jgi:pilus assembly protein CpaF